MKFSKRPDRAFVFTAILIALLVLFAIVQYRWVGQVNEAEREKVQESLRIGVNRFCRDFDREITKAFFFFQLRRVEPQDGPERYAALYRRWLASSEHPQLVSDVLVATCDENRELRLSRMEPASGALEPVSWYSDFGGVRDRLQSDCEGATTGSVAILNALRDPIVEDVPAIVIPPFSLLLAVQNDQPSVDLTRLHQELGTPRTREYVILRLNREYITSDLLPSLARQHFSSGSELDYRLRVINRSDPRSLIYASDSEGATTMETPDATAQLFSIRHEDVTGIVAGERDDSAVLNRKRIAISVYRPTATADSAGLPGEGRWELTVKHRAGSLDAVIASARRRNLLASLGILILLASSVIMLAASTRRSQRLARQQMEFVAGVSHELRTPLTVIRTAGQNLADGVATDPQQVATYGALIESEGRHLQEIVEQVLQLAGVQSGRKTYALSRVDIKEVIESALRACEPQAKAGDFRLESALEEPLPQVDADSAALSQAIQNLLSNAMKYSGPSRVVRLSARQAKRNGSSELLISVTDNGLGIDRADLPHIFEPFYRGASVVAEQIHGNGIGLSLVKQIVEAHGGVTTVESVAGAGSTFTIHISTARGATNGGEQTSS